MLIMKNNRKRWQLEKVHAAIPLFSENEEDIGSKKPDIHIASSSL